MSEDEDIGSHSSIIALTYDKIDCMSPGEADGWADEDIFNIDYHSDRDLKQKLKLHVTRYKQKHVKNYQETRAKTVSPEIIFVTFSVRLSHEIAAFLDMIRK